MNLSCGFVKHITTSKGHLPSLPCTALASVNLKKAWTKLKCDKTIKTPSYSTYLLHTLPDPINNYMALVPYKYYNILNKTIDIHGKAATPIAIFVKVFHLIRLSVCMHILVQPENNMP